MAKLISDTLREMALSLAEGDEHEPFHLVRRRQPFDGKKTIRGIAPPAQVNTLRAGKVKP